jgi:ribosome-associated toxin RatA of RatAB toxin-antitoxin module
MKHVEILAQVNGYSVTDAYARISDFPRYPDFSEAVRAVTLLEARPDYTLSSWEANFRQGILQWVEEDHFDRANNTIHFNQTEGDADYFAGSWRVIPHEDERTRSTGCRTEDACRIHFTAAIDLGIPTMADILEPIAERALHENIRSIISGLFPSAVQFL